MTTSILKDTKNLDCMKFLQIVLSNLKQPYTVEDFSKIIEGDETVKNLRDIDGRIPGYHDLDDLLYRLNVKSLNMGYVSEDNHRHTVKLSKEKIDQKLKNGWRSRSLDLNRFANQRHSHDNLVAMARDFLVETHRIHGYDERPFQDFVKVLNSFDSLTDSAIYTHAIAAALYENGLIQLYGDTGSLGAETVYNSALRLVPFMSRIRKGVFDDPVKKDSIMNAGYRSNEWNGNIPPQDAKRLAEVAKLEEPFGQSDIISSFYKKGFLEKSSSYTVGEGYNNKFIFKIKKEVRGKIRNMYG